LPFVLSAKKRKTQKTTSKKHTFYVDFLRFLAIADITFYAFYQ